MKIEHGNFKVVRKCCTSGCCIDCQASFDLKKRRTVVQIDNLSRETADAVAENWKAYQAEVVPMDVGS